MINDLLTASQFLAELKFEKLRKVRTTIEEVEGEIRRLREKGTVEFVVPLAEVSWLPYRGQVLASLNLQLAILRAEEEVILEAAADAFAKVGVIRALFES